MKKILILLILVIFISSCNNNAEDKNMANKEKISFKTEDNYNIAGIHYKARGDSIILLHQLGKDKGSWDNFARLLQGNNYDVLAIDLRGHGESDGDLNKFTEKEFDNMKFDIKAAVNYLNKSKIGIIGASIGANLALNYAVKDNKVKAIVMLSPGLNYRGISTENNANKYDKNSLVIVSQEDSYSYNSSNRLHSLLSGNKQIKIYKNIGHGTDMFIDKDLNKFILQWLNLNY